MNGYRETFEMLKKFEGRMREQVAQEDYSELSIQPETYDDLWGTHTHYTVNGEPNIYVERSKGGVPAQQLFFRLSNYENGDDLSKGTKIFLDVSRTAILYAIQRDGQAVAALSIDPKGSGSIKIPSQFGDEFKSIDNIDFKEVLNGAIQGNNGDSFHTEALKQGLDFFSEIEDYANGKKISRENPSSEKNQESEDITY